MAVDRLDVSTQAGESTPVARGSDAIGPVQGDARIDAPFSVGAVAAAGPRRSRATDDESIDAVSEVTALAEGRSISGPASGLAAQLLDYVTPRPRNSDAFTQPRIVPLLGLAADHVGGIAGGSDILDSLGIKALQQELQHHRDIAERRSNRLEP